MTVSEFRSDQSPVKTFLNNRKPDSHPVLKLLDLLSEGVKPFVYLWQHWVSPQHMHFKTFPAFAYVPV